MKGVLAAAAVAGLLTFRDYGVTWDEPGHHDNGLVCARYYASGFRTPPSAPLYAMYGTAFDWPAAVLAESSPLGVWPTRHLLNFLTGLSALAGTAAVARRLGGPGAGAAAALLLALTPAWWGHQFNNPKDVPFAAACVWALAWLLDSLAAPVLTWRLALGFGAVAGLAMGVRAGGVLLLGFLAAVALVRRLRGDRAAPARALAAGALAWGVMLVFWPEAHRSPLRWPLDVVFNFARHITVVPSVIFGGRIVLAQDLPWDYIPRYLAFTLPEPFVLLLPLAAWAALRRPSSGPLLVLAAALIPAASAIALRASLFNGLRHLLFILPPLAALSAVAAERLWSGLGSRARIAALAAIAAWGAWHLSVMVRLHPLETVYYNAFAGGLPGAYERYELDYWGNSFPEAFIRLREYLAARGEAAPGRPWRVKACGAPRALAAVTPPDFTWAGTDQDADFMIGLVGVGCPELYQAVVATRVTRFGIPLAWILDLRGRKISPTLRP